MVSNELPKCWGLLSYGLQCYYTILSTQGMTLILYKFPTVLTAKDDMVDKREKKFWDNTNKQWLKFIKCFEITQKIADTIYQTYWPTLQDSSIPLQINLRIHTRLHTNS